MKTPLYEWTARTATPLGSPPWRPRRFCAAFCCTSCPPRFVRIRHYGWLANAARKRLLPTVRELLASADPAHTSPARQAPAPHAAAPLEPQAQLLFIVGVLVGAALFIKELRRYF